MVCLAIIAKILVLQLQNTSSILVAFTACILSHVLVKFYCDVITRNRLQLINTLIDTLFSKLHAFSMEKRRRKTKDG